MMWVLGLLVLAVIGGIAVVAAGGGDPLALEYDDRRDVTVPTDRPIRSSDLSRLRFTSAFRGYRASEVDALLDRLAAQLAQTEAAPVEAGLVEAGPVEAAPVDTAPREAAPVEGVETGTTTQD
jgi:DivIVA domain-containing protein